MIQVRFIKDFNAADLNRTNLRRGFVIPFRSAYNKALIITDNDNAMDHEYIADDFVKLSSDETLQSLLRNNPHILNEDLQKSLLICEQIRNGYREKEEEYPTSRKDYLIYEEASVCFDQRPGYSNKYIMYRTSGKGYTLPDETDKIACSFLMAGFKESIAPEDNKYVGPAMY